MTEDFEKAIKAILSKIGEAKDAAEAARLAEVAINLSHAAVAMKEAKSGEGEA